jgi:hypothetical protein
MVAPLLRAAARWRISGRPVAEEHVVAEEQHDALVEAGVCPDPRRVDFRLQRIVIGAGGRQQLRFAAASRICRGMLSVVREPAAG